MSIAPTSQSTLQPVAYVNGERIPPSELFDELVFHSSEWCSACFCRIRDVEEIDTDRWGSGNQPGQIRTRLGEGYLGHDFETHDDYGVARSWHAKTYCGSCGANNGHLDDLTIGKRDAVRRADALVDCLLEQGVPVHRKSLQYFVGGCKERDAIAGDDHEIFARAVEFARREFLKRHSDE